jgi:hypothetical protein
MSKGLDAIREQLHTANKGGATYRELSAQIGVSPFILWKLLDRKQRNLRSATLLKLQTWAQNPGGAEIARQFRSALRRVVGRLPAREARNVEGAVGRVIVEALTRAGEDIPRWVTLLGKRQK